MLMQFVWVWAWLLCEKAPQIFLTQPTLQRTSLYVIVGSPKSLKWWHPFFFCLCFPHLESWQPCNVSMMNTLLIYVSKISHHWDYYSMYVWNIFSSSYFFLFLVSNHCIYLNTYEIYFCISSLLKAPALKWKIHPIEKMFHNLFCEREWLLYSEKKVPHALITLVVWMSNVCLKLMYLYT